MLRGVAIATSQLLAQSERLDLLAANLTEVDTPGYRADRVDEQSFSRILLSRIDQGTTPVGPLELGPVLARPSIDLSTGPVDPTGRPLDVALTGPGFFAVQSPTGVRYTRRGSFHQDGAGRLVSLEGWPVLGQNGNPIAAPGPLSIAPDGQVMAGDRAVGRLRVVTFPPTTVFQRTGGTYLVPPAGTAAQPVATPELLPGHLEGSNVNLVTLLTGMMEATRAYQSAQRAVTTESDALGRLIQRAGGG